MGLCRLRGIPSPPASATASCRRAVLHRHDDCAASIRKSGPEIKNRCTQEGVNGEKLTSIRKFGPEIKNHCSRGAVSWRNLAVILKLTPSNQESLQLWDCFWAIPCSDSQIDPMKSRITAAFGLFPRKSMHRFPSLGLKSRITACSRPSSARVH